MKRRRLCVSGLLAAVTMLTACDPVQRRGGVSDDAARSREPERISLRLHLEPGESYRLRMLVDQDITQTVMGQAQDMKQAIGMGFCATVREVGADSVCSLTYKYEKMLYRQEGPLGVIEYDSDNPPEVVHPIAQGFAALIGKGFTARIKPTGEIIEVGGLDALVDAILKEVPMLPGMVEQFREQFGEESMKQMIQQACVIFPEQPLAIGDDWSNSIVISRGFPIIVDNDWTLAAVDGDVLRLGVASEISPNPDGKPLQMGGVTLGYALSGEQVGMLTVDRKTGWTIGGEMSQMLEGEIRIGGVPGQEGDMKWPIQVNSKITFESYEL